MTQRRYYLPEDQVFTKTISGAEILCTVVEAEVVGGEPTGEYILDSPEHGYYIIRHASELKLARRPKARNAVR